MNNIEATSEPTCVLITSNRQSQFSLAKQDLLDTLKNYRYWLELGWTDIKLRYRGSVLGPFWITLSMIIFVTFLGIVYSRLLKQSLNEFIPYLTAGLTIWTMISTQLTESCELFPHAKYLIDNIKLPFNIHVARCLWRNVLIMFHNLLVFFIVMVIFHIKVTLYTLLFIPGLCLVLMNLYAIALLLAMLGARFRDLPPVITSLITVAFFVSPITWHSKMVGKHSLIVKLNPISYYLNLVRAPLLGHAPAMLAWLYCTVLSLTLFAVAFMVFARYRRRIAFWV